MNSILQSGQLDVTVKLYGTEPRYNEILEITKTIQKPKHIMHQSIPAVPIPPPGLTPGR